MLMMMFRNLELCYLIAMLYEFEYLISEKSSFYLSTFDIDNLLYLIRADPQYVVMRHCYFSDTSQNTLQKVKKLCCLLSLC